MEEFIKFIKFIRSIRSRVSFGQCLSAAYSYRRQSAPQGTMDLIDLMDFTDFIDPN